jgi:hypothetical protein
MSIKLTDTQLMMLSAASQREDRCICAQSNLKGPAAQKSVAKLVAMGLAKEIKAKPGAHVWRRDEATGQAYALKLTSAGLRAIAAEEHPADLAAPGSTGVEHTVAVTAPASMKAAAQQPQASIGAKGSPRSKVRAMPSLGETLASSAAADPMAVAASGEATRTQTAGDIRATIAATPRQGSKLASVIDMLKGEGGATIEELAVAMVWLPHTTRAALTGLRKRGFALHRERGDDQRASRYSISRTLAATSEA